MTARRITHPDEYDAYTSWRRVIGRLARPGAVRAIKRRTHKRERREARAMIRDQREA